MQQEWKILEKAFEYIVKTVGEELAKQNFSQAQGMEDPNGPAAMFVSGTVAYSVLYHEKDKLFELRSSVLDDAGKPGAWKNLSKWIYNEEKGDDFSVAQSIATDFCDTVRGPQRVLQMQQLRNNKKKKSEDENYIEPLFFYNRLCSVFDDLKQQMNQERIVYGQVRSVAFAREQVLPRLEAACSTSPLSEQAKKACTVLCDNYKNGDRDTRSIITAILLTGLSDVAYAAAAETFEGDLKEVAPSARRLRGKKIKPEKVKKTKGFIADTLNNAK